MTSAELAEPGSAMTHRVDLVFVPNGKGVRVPAGVTVFDAASWNGIAIDSTCGGHGTCKKCRVRVVSGDAPVSPVDPRAFSTEELRGGWRLACRAAAGEDLLLPGREVPLDPPGFYLVNPRSTVVLLARGHHATSRMRQPRRPHSVSATASGHVLGRNTSCTS